MAHSSHLMNEHFFRTMMSARMPVFSQPLRQLSRRYRHYVICGGDRSIHPQVLADLLLTIGARVRAT
jgi:hypothetical protein